MKPFNADPISHALIGRGDEGLIRRAQSSRWTGGLTGQVTCLEPHHLECPDGRKGARRNEWISQS